MNNLKTLDTFIATKKGRVFSRKYFPEINSAKSMIMLHEGLGCTESWGIFPELISLQTGFNVITYDRLGYGKSDQTEIYSSNDYFSREAESTLCEVVNYYQLNELVLYGHSDGGSISICFAGLFPDKVKGLITEAAHVICEEVTFKGVHSVGKSYQLGKAKAVLENIHHNNTETAFRTWFTLWSNPEIKELDLTPFLNKFKCPVLAIQGEEDRYGTFEQLNLIKKHTKNARIELLENCGHMAHKDQQEKILNLIVDFIHQF